jgi:hypothetical protein
MFRVKLVRETRTGEYRNGNFPQGAGALWIPYEEVDFEPHLKNLTRHEVKEYSRIRQYQIDHGEKPEERIDNETQAVYKAQSRVMALRAVQNHTAEDVDQTTPAEFTAAAGTPGATSFTPVNAATPSNDAQLGAEGVRTSRRVEARHQQQQEQEQQMLKEQEEQRKLAEQQHAHSGQQHQPEHRSTQVSVDGRRSLAPAGIAPAPTGHFGPLQRATTLAQREVARAEATQGRADAQVTHRQRAQVAAEEAASAAAAAAAAAASSPANRPGGTFQQNSEVQRLNSVWARQESMRARAGAEDVKVYDNIKYERKSNGPFFGKLVSPGNLINIDGEDYVEYRVLTKPSFY